MACELSTGFGLGCNDTIGGVKEIYFGKFSDFSGEVTFDATTGEVEALPEATVYKYVPHRNTASWTEETTANQDNGSIFWTNTVTLSLKKLTQKKQKELQALAFGRWVAFVRDQNDDIWMVGYNEGLLVSGGNGQTGQAKGDLNGYVITLVEEAKYRANRLESFTTDPFDNAGFADITIGGVL